MSVVNEMTPIGIKEDDLNLLRNDHIKFDCGPLVYRTIIHWGFDLPEGKKIIDHINDLEIVDKIKEKCNFDLKKWIKKNKTKITEDSFSDFDITALHSFLPILCYDKIAQLGSQEYEKRTKDTNSVESLLKKIKDFRNDISHDIVEAVKECHIDEMTKTMRECIRAAGKLYCKDQTEIDRKVNDLDDEFKKILLDRTHLYENRVKYIAQKISSEVPSNMLERYSKIFTVPLPDNSKYIDTSEIYQCSKLSIITEDKEDEKKDNKNIIPCTEIFNNNRDNFVVINGGPGSGKTTLLRNMCQDILETSVHGSTPRYKNIEQFKVPIYLECRSEQQTNLAKFLRECLNDFLSPEVDIMEAFKKVEGSEFLIDGYDEITDSCRQLVDDIIVYCRDNNTSCIVSSRVDAGNDFVIELQANSLNCTKMFIEPISEMSDKVNFLMSYADKMDGTFDTNKLVNSFENLTAVAREVFSSPILLALFISMFVVDPDTASQLTNEQSAYKAVRTNFLREIARKLRYVRNPKGRALDVANVLGKFCLKFFRAKKYYFVQDEYLKMVAECEEIKGISDRVDMSSLLSCILTPEHSFKYSLNISYQFMHSSIQESFAAKYVSENIRKSQDERNSQGQSEDIQLPNLLQFLELDESQRDIIEEMERYGNIIKLLMLETLANKELKIYRNTFTELLKKYYKPKYNSTDYYLDLILSSDSNASIVSIVSDCMIGWERYNLHYYKHINPMIEVVKRLHGFKINFISNEITNSQQIIKLLSVLGDDSEIQLRLRHSYYNYQPLEDEFYTQLKKIHIRCKVTWFKACISSEEHLYIVMRVLSGYSLNITTPSVTDIRFAALEEHEGGLFLTVKYNDDFHCTGTNPVTCGTVLTIEHIPANGKKHLYNLLKYLCPISKEFYSIYLDNCHLTDAHANELLMNLHGEKIRTKGGVNTEVKEERVKDKSRWLELHLKESKEEEGEMKRREEEGNKGKKRCLIS